MGFLAQKAQVIQNIEILISSVGGDIVDVCMELDNQSTV
jgi:hypothetical protein